ncbi:DUF1707 and DUF4190 domain-containing protein [Kitasatospora sp. NPDC052896]|uniref:DUF1707 and DUF4190 domain-containing protein n=1 Tax=Kitasatospora sp. NPDC052896 TaxID=3364061 RepID=UPI0037C51C65
MGDVQPWPGAQPQPQPYAAGWQPAAGPQSAMRAAHTDRDRTVDVLKAAYAEGRLSAEEYSQRFEVANRAQTYGQLAQLVADLPSGPLVAPQGAVVPPTFLSPTAFAPPRNNSMAIASLVLGVLSVPTLGALALPAVATGHLARRQMKQTAERGEGMATAGLVIGYTWVAGWSLLILLGMLLFVSGH